MRQYELMVILDPELEERTVAPSLDQFLNVVRNGGGTVEKGFLWSGATKKASVNFFRFSRKGNYYVEFQTATNRKSVFRNCSSPSKIGMARRSRPIVARQVPSSARSHGRSGHITDVSRYCASASSSLPENCSACA